MEGAIRPMLSYVVDVNVAWEKAICLREANRGKSHHLFQRERALAHLASAVTRPSPEVAATPLSTHCSDLSRGPAQPKGPGSIILALLSKLRTDDYLMSFTLIYKSFQTITLINRKYKDFFNLSKLSETVTWDSSDINVSSPVVSSLLFSPPLLTFFSPALLPFLLLLLFLITGNLQPEDTMIIYRTEAIASFINWIPCWLYLVILLTVSWSWLPSFIRRENEKWMSLLTAESQPQSVVLRVAVWHLKEKGISKIYYQMWQRCLYLPYFVSIFHSTKYCKINLLKAQSWSCHHCTENISTYPHPLQTKFDFSVWHLVFTVTWP